MINIVKCVSFCMYIYIYIYIYSREWLCYSMIFYLVFHQPPNFRKYSSNLGKISSRNNLLGVTLRNVTIIHGALSYNQPLLFKEWCCNTVMLEIQEGTRFCRCHLHPPPKKIRCKIKLFSKTQRNWIHSLPTLPLSTIPCPPPNSTCNPNIPPNPPRV